VGTSRSWLEASRPDLEGSRRTSGRLVHLAGMSTENHHETLASTGSTPSGLEVITITDLAEKLGVTAQTIDDLRTKGRGPRGFRVGRRLMFRVCEIEAWLAEMEDADGQRRRGVR